MLALQTYLSRLSQLRQNTQATGELSLRPALDELFQSLKPAGVDFVGEGKQLAIGRPDFTFTRGIHDDPIGYVEAEKTGADLGNLTGHAKTQNERFCANFDNFLLTNHFDFRLYDGNALIEQVSLPEQGAQLTTKHETDFARLWERFTSAQITAAQTPRELAQVLSRRARGLRVAIEESLEWPNSPLHQDLAAFRKLLLPDLTAHDFANLYAETLAYGLFAARCQNTDTTRFEARTADRALRRTPLLRTLYRLFEADIDKNLEWILKDMEAILNGAAIDEIRAYFSNRQGRPDPMIDFYEPFLAQYDARARQSRGVYYTPEPVVSYIVRSVHALLKNRFDMELGLAGGAKILDPATGTGSFLFAVLDEMHREITAGDWKSFVRDKKPLDNIFGFELMVAPYTVAHLKLALQLEGLGTPLGESERLGIFLTNTLDDARRQSEAILENSIADEVNLAADVKEKSPIIVVLGNPPYAGHSSNSSTKMSGDERVFTHVGKQIESYKSIDGVSLGERNSKWLQDDYVKFLAFAQKRIEASGEGIVAFITPHGYFDNPTFRGMRKSFLDTFSMLYLLDLHGNANKKEVAPDGSADKNVFDIKQGVAILLAVKEKNNSGAAEVFYAELWGNRETKEKELKDNDVTTTKWQKLTPSAPLFLFKPRDEELLPEYEKGWKITDILPMNVTGFQTHRDSVAIGFNRTSLKEQIANFLKADDEKLDDSTGNCAFRPFDNRFCCFDLRVTDRPRPQLVNTVLNKQNLCLGVGRQGLAVSDPEWALVTCSKFHMDANIFRRGGVNVFPLYLYDEKKEVTKKVTGTLSDLEITGKRANISAKYLSELAAIVGETPTPETVFGYIYARLHSPLYRARFAAFLKTDFPRVPMPDSRGAFESLSALGAQLVALHTLDSKAAPVLKLKRHALNEGSDMVEKPRYDATARRVWINDNQSFSDVDAGVYGFKIGGYQVAEKWLADRRGRALSFEERRLYPQILVALGETRRIMAEIDEVNNDE